MTDREDNEAVMATMTAYVPPMRRLRDRLAADGPFDTVAFSAKSDRWPEEVRVAARNKPWDLHFKCDSNEVCRLYLRDSTRRPPRARPKTGFFLTGLLKADSIGPLCEAVPRIVGGLKEFLQRPVQGDLDEARRREVRAAFEEHTIVLNDSTLMPLSGFDEEHVTALANQFMNDNPDIFNHPRADVRTIYRTDEVQDWLLARSDLASADALELKLLRYTVFRTVQDLCYRARSYEAFLLNK